MVIKRKLSDYPSAADLEAEERKRKKELKDYRAKKTKVWYLNK